MSHRVARGHAMFTVAVALIASVVILAAVTVEELGYRAAANRADCESSRDLRDDHRSMWIWLVEQFPGDSLAADARVELDRRLPSLMCVGDSRIPVPVPPAEPGSTP